MSISIIKNIILFLLITFLYCRGYGQDIHFSQFVSSPLNLNPANAGNFKGKYRFCLNNKNQWSSVSVPYQTFSLSADLKLKIKNQLSFIGTGIILNRDKAGDSEFGTTQASVGLSYLLSLNNKGSHYLTFGIMPGIAQRTINLKKLTFGDQFDDATFTYDSNLPNNETLSTTNFTFFDFSAGATWSYFPSNNTFFNVGLSMFHLNKPKQSFFNNNSIRLNRKVIASVQSKISIRQNRFISHPCFIFISQGKYKEYIIGSKFCYLVKQSLKDQYSFNLGLYTRAGDAAIFMLGMDYNSASLGISYDVNYSRLHNASLYRGGLELSLMYNIQSAKFRSPAKVPCPIF